MSMSAVARAAGVSTATVSRVLNDFPGVRSETVEQVRAAARALNYSLPSDRQGSSLPRKRPRLPRGSRTGNLAILTIGQARDWLQLPVMATVVTGIQRGVADAGMRLLLDEIPDMKQPCSLIGEHRIDGAVVFVSSAVDIEECVHFLAEVSKQLPTVWAMGVPIGADGIDHVTYDQNGVGRLAYQYLKNAGCRDFAYFTDRPDWRLLRLRGQAFCNAAFEDRQIPTSFIVSEDDVLAASFGHRVHRSPTFSACVDKMLQTLKRPGGVFVANDATIAPLYLELAQRGIPVGEDIRLISCDNEEIRLSTLRPRPASIDLCGGEVGYRAVSRLLMRKQRPDGPPVLIQVQPRLETPSTS